MTSPLVTFQLSKCILADVTKKMFWKALRLDGDHFNVAIKWPANEFDRSD